LARCSAVPTTTTRHAWDGGHGARERAFAHPTRDLRVNRHSNIHVVVAHLHVDRAQAILGIAAMAAGLDVELPAVPGTDDVLLAGEFEPAAGLVRPQFLLDARDHLALTDRAAVVRAEVLVGDEPIALPEDAELERIDPQHAIAALGKLAELAHHDLVHPVTPPCCAVTRWERGGTTSAGRRN